MNFVDKYFPKNVSEIVGLDDNLQKITEFLEKFSKQKKKSLLLVGPEGSGKTSSVYAIAKTLDYEVVEVNASDKRNAENIQKIVGNASKQKNLFDKQKIILIDEVDGLQGNQDRGGVKEINKILKQTSFPIIMTANDAYNPRIKSIKLNAKVITFKKRSYWDIYKILKQINELEGKQLSADSLKKLSSMAQGDVRSALNDLQNLQNDEEINELFERVKEESIFDKLKKIFKSKTFETLNESLNDITDLEYTILTVGENIPNEYEKKEEIQEAYDYFSKSYVMLGRMFRTGHWRLGYVYSKLLASIGIGLSKEEMYRKFTVFTVPPFYIRRMSTSKKTRNELKELTKVIGKQCHCSSKKAKDYLVLFKLINQSN